MNTALAQQLSDVSVKEAAQLLHLRPKKLFALLREHNIFTAENLPYGPYTARGFFRVELKSTPVKPLYFQPRVTGNGLVFIKELLAEFPEEAAAITLKKPNAPKNSASANDH